MEFRFRILTSIFVAALVFTIVVVSFSEGLRWPVSLPTLGVVLGIAWLVGGVAGEVIAKTKWPAVVVTMLSVGLILSTLGFGVPWRLGEGEVEEIIWFRIEASFTYRGSANNLPIENITLCFPCPNVENVGLDLGVMGEEPIWWLYYVENDNTLTLQATSKEVYEFRGERTETLEIMDFGIEATSYGPKIYYDLTKLYPREVFLIIAYSPVSKENAKKVTLVEFKENMRTLAYYDHRMPTEEFIDLSFWAQLSKKIDNTYEVLETFSRSYDNGAPGGYWLYPS